MNDPYGVITEAAARRALYGDRRTHGKVSAPPPPPPGVLAATVNPFERVKPEPAAMPPIRGRNIKYCNPDDALAEAIKTAGAICSERCERRERWMTMQSTIYLVYSRARVGLRGVADMYGYADHTGARPSIRAVRDRMNRAITADDEEARQARIMRLVNQNIPGTDTIRPTFHGMIK